MSTFISFGLFSFLEIDEGASLEMYRIELNSCRSTFSITPFHTPLSRLEERRPSRWEGRGGIQVVGSSRGFDRITQKYLRRKVSVLTKLVTGVEEREGSPTPTSTFNVGRITYQLRGRRWGCGQCNRMFSVNGEVSQVLKILRTRSFTPASGSYLNNNFQCYTVRQRNFGFVSEWYVESLK